MPESTLNDLPVIKADDEHLQVERTDGATPPAYEIPAGDGLVLDVTDYTIPIPPELRITQPNMIQVVFDRQVYYVIWEAGKTSYPLTAQTLQPLQGLKFFSGFKSGQTVILAIGYWDKDRQTTGQVVFYPLWYAIVNVR